eukprot:TRINITY_DN9061_c0_g1_i1.p1 TRINITY_DN9061_c0_g1~~TRINITY_DN9061_c0_g1_i1.p1  ORF type:complete len:1129 (+),score=213.80 TRINITY_DN9061_c0_g1_i1:1076-4462(+)
MRILESSEACPSSGNHFHFEIMHTAADAKDLFQAAQNGNTAQVLKILKTGADGNANDRNGWTVLHHAAAYNKKGCLEAVLKYPGINVNPQDNRGRTPLHRAAMWGNVETVEVLLAAGADATVRNAWGAVPLQDALRQLTVEFNPAKDTIDGLLNILHPDRNQHVAIVKRLLAQTDEVEKMVCEEVRKSGIVPLAAFLAAGVDVAHCHDDNESLLHIVVHKTDVPAVDLVLRLHPDLEARNRWNVTPLVVAVERNHPQIAGMLLKAGASVDCRDADGNTPLHMAAEAGYAETCDLLIQFNARVRAQNSKGAAPIHKAAGYGRLEVLKVLRDADAGCVHCITKKRVTPLHWAARNGHVKCARLLLESGADANAANQAGEKPMDVTSSPEMKELLRMFSMADSGRRARSFSTPVTPPRPGPPGTAPAPQQSSPGPSPRQPHWRDDHPQSISPQSMGAAFPLQRSLSPSSQITAHAPVLMRSRTQSQHQPSTMGLPPYAPTQEPIGRPRTSSQHGAQRPVVQHHWEEADDFVPRGRAQSQHVRATHPFLHEDDQSDAQSLLAQLRVGSEPQPSTPPPASPPILSQKVPVNVPILSHLLAPGAPPSKAFGASVEDRLGSLNSIHPDSVSCPSDANDVEMSYSHLFVKASVQGQPCIVKKLSARFDDVSAREVRMHACISHPNIAHFGGYFMRDSRYHVVLEGPTRGLVSNVVHTGMDLNLGNVIRIAFGVANGLAYFYNEGMQMAERMLAAEYPGSVQLHVVHRTLAPRTVLVDENYSPLLTDFGVTVAGEPLAPPVVSINHDPLKYFAPEQVAFLDSVGALNNEAVSVFQFAYLLFTLLTGTDVFPQTSGQKVIQGLMNENQYWQQAQMSGRPVDNASMSFRPSMEGVRLPENMFTQRLVNLMNQCWAHVPSTRPNFQTIRTTLEPFRRMLDEQPPIPLFWTAVQRLDMLTYVGTQLSELEPAGDNSPQHSSPRLLQSNGARSSPLGTIASVVSTALATLSSTDSDGSNHAQTRISLQQLSERLDIGGCAITAGDWRVFFPLQLISRVEDRLLSQHSPAATHASLSALLRLVATFRRRMLPDHEWAEVRMLISVHTPEDLARYIDACFPGLANHVYLALRHFRPDLLTAALN